MTKQAFNEAFELICKMFRSQNNKRNEIHVVKYRSVSCERRTEIKTAKR